MQLPGKLKPILTTPKRVKLAYGGRGGAKSETFAIAAILAMGSGKKIGFFREFQNSIDDSVYSMIRGKIEQHQIPGFTILANEIRHESGGMGVFKGIARNITSIKSMYEFDIFWVEEAQTISYNSLETLTPTLRKNGSELWFTMNRSSSADPIDQRYIKPFEKELTAKGVYEDDKHLIIKINYSDNPWFPKVLEDERLDDKKRLSAAKYRNKWLGDTNDEVNGSIIPVEWFDACVDAHKVLGFDAKGLKQITHDPSDEGDDPKGIAIRHGVVVTHFEEKDDGDAGDGMDWALQRALEEHCSLFRWDCDGLGVSLKRQAEQIINPRPEIDWQMFKGSEAPSSNNLYTNESGKGKGNKQTFKNKRAECYWRLRERCYKTYRFVVHKDICATEDMISFASEGGNIDELRAQICRVPIDPRSEAAGIIKIMSKPEMLKMGIYSPNMSDCIMMQELPYSFTQTEQDFSKLYVMPADNWG